jgi:putative endonuclease
MYYIYLLKLPSGRFYTGYTNNLKRRLAEHRKGKTYTTSRENSFKLIYFDVYSKIELAKEREVKLKQHGSAYHGLLNRLKIIKKNKGE